MKYPPVLLLCRCQGSRHTQQKSQRHCMEIYIPAMSVCTCMEIYIPALSVCTCMEIYIPAMSVCTCMYTYMTVQDRQTMLTTSCIYMSLHPSILESGIYILYGHKSIFTVVSVQCIVVCSPFCRSCDCSRHSSVWEICVHYGVAAIAQTHTYIQYT